MARGRKTALTIHLTAGTRRTLQAWQRMSRTPRGQARRAQIILLLAEGVPIATVATRVGIGRRFVYKWAKRFQQDGVAGLRDKPGRGRRSAPPLGLPEQPDVCA